LSFTLTPTNVIGNLSFLSGPSIDPATGNLSFQTSPDTNGSAVIEVVLMDDGGTSNGGSNRTPVQRFTVTVNPINDAPFVVVDPAKQDPTRDEDSGLVVIGDWASKVLPGPPTATDEVTQLLTATAAATTSPAAGFFTRSIEFDPATGDLSFEVAPNIFGTATFTVTVTDDGGTPSVMTDDKFTTLGPFTLTITAVNDPPVPGADEFLGTAGVLEDGGNTQGLAATGSLKTILVSTLLANDAAGPIPPDNEANQTLTLLSVTNPASGGTAVRSGNGMQIFYTPGRNFNGIDTFTYVVQDADSSNPNFIPRQATGTVSIEVAAVNDAPVAENDPPASLVGAYTTDEDSTLVVAGVGTIFNDTDVDSANLEVSALDTTSVPTRGDVVFLDVDVMGVPFKNGDFRYEPSGRFESLSVGDTTTDKFLYKITDNDPTSPRESNFATVTVRITGVNDAPTAVAIAKTISENGQLIAIPFVGDDVDLDDGPSNLTYNIVSPTSLGTVRKGNPNVGEDPQTFYFDPGTEFDDLQSGDPPRVVKFTYTATDSHGAVSSLATVTISVNGQNDAPIVNDVTISTSADAATVAPFDADDVDHDDDTSTLTYMVDDSGLTGTKSVTVGFSDTSVPPNGFFEFDPGTDFVALAAGETTTVVFPYTATDSQGASVLANVTVVVTGVNEAPTVQPVSILAAEDGPAVTGTFLGDDVDTDDTQATLIYSLIGQLPANSGTLDNNNNGTFTFRPGPDFQDLAANATRVVTFRYSAKDSHDAFSPTATGTITVTGKNDAPTVAGLSLTTGENQSLTANFSGSDVDTGGVLTFADNALQGGGSLTNNSDGTFTFDPGTAFDHLAANGNATVTFTYFASDGTAASSLATVTITVRGANDAPTAQNVSVAAMEDGPIVTAQFVGDDVDDDDNPSSLSYTIISSPSAGNVVHSGGRTFSFDPGPDFQELFQNETLDVTFEYEVRDRFSQVSPMIGTVTVTVTGKNDAPVVSNISGLVAVENGPAITGNFVAQDVDSDETGTGIQFAVLSQPSEGTVTPTTTAPGSTVFTFDPGAAFQDLSVSQSRQVKFTYRASDTHAGLSQLGTVTITVNGANDAPVAQNISGVAAVEDGSPVNITLQASDIDSDETGATLSYSLKDPPPVGSGSVSISNVPGNAIAVYDPGNDFQDLFVGETRQVTFTYAVTDQHSGESNTATVTAVVTGVNDAPVAENRTLTGVNEDGPAKTGSFFATDADSDETGSGFVYSIVTQPPQGQVTVSGIAGNANYDFDPAGGFHDLSVGASRNVTFTYRVTDTHSGVGTATVTVTVVGANDRPTVSTVNVTANEDGGAVTRAFAGNDIDSDDSQQTLTYQFASSLPSTQGTIVKDPSNPRQFIYDPGANFQELGLGEIGAVQVPYTATDRHFSQSTSGTISVSIIGANDAPTAAALSFNVNEGGSITQSFGGNDVDNDDSLASLQFTLVAQPSASAGSVTNNGGSTFTFVPGSSFESLALGQQGSTSFTYLARDRHGVASNVATVTITVDGVNDKPVVQNLSISAVEDGGPVGGTFLGDDIDTDDSSATIVFTVASQPSEGSASSAGGNSFTFNPGSDFQNLGVNETRTVTFTYTAVDSHSATSDPATVTVTVSGVNDSPVANDDHASTLEGQVQTINVIGPDAGGEDTDPDGDALTIASHQPTSANGAEISLSASSVLTYNPLPSATLNGLAAGEMTTDTFEYTVSDGRGGTSTATVTVTVTGVNNAPTALEDSFSASADTTLDITAPGVLGDDTDPDPGTTLSVSSIDAISLRGAAITSDGNGGFTYDPTGVEGFQLLAANETLDDTFTYVASDGSLTSNFATVTVTVNGVNDTPFANSESYSTAEETTLQISAFAGVLANDRDIENDPLSVTLVTGVANGTLNLSGNGAFTYTPALNFNGNDTFAYRVSDGNSSAVATATIIVSGVNDAPVAVADQYSMSQGSMLQVAALNGVLANDSDVDNANSSLQSLARSLPTNGSVILFADGHFTYTPTPDFSGISTFTYQAVDPSGARSALTTVEITVIAGNVSTWHNSQNQFDVNNDGFVTAVDALQVINDLNRDGSRVLPALPGGPPFVDVNDDGSVTPLDALLVINEINRAGAGGEGEGLMLAGGDDSLASASITVLATTNALNLSDAGNLIAPNDGQRPGRLSSPMFKVEGGLISPIDKPLATVNRFDVEAEPARRPDSVRGGWNDLLTDLASVQRRSSPTDDALAALDDDPADLLDSVLDDLLSR